MAKPSAFLSEHLVSRDPRDLEDTGQLASQRDTGKSDKNLRTFPSRGSSPSPIGNGIVDFIAAKRTVALGSSGSTDDLHRRSRAFELNSAIGRPIRRVSATCRSNTVLE